MRQFSEQATSALGQDVGNATVLRPEGPNAIDYLMQAGKYKQDQLNKQRELRDKRIDEMYKYNTPDAVFHAFENQRNKDVQDFLNYRADLMGKGVVDPTSPDYMKYEQMKYKLAQDKAKSDDIKKTYYDAYEKHLPYTNVAEKRKLLNDYTFGQDGSGRTYSDVNPQGINEVNYRPETLDSAGLVQDFVKALPESVNQIVQTKKIQVGDTPGIYFDETKEQSKFFTRDNKGNLVLNITPETKELLKSSDPRVEGFIQMQLQKPENKGKTEDDIINDMFKPYAYTNKLVNRSGITKENRNPSKEGTSQRKTNSLDRFAYLRKMVDGDANTLGALVGKKYLGMPIRNVAYETDPRSGQKTVALTMNNKYGMPEKRYIHIGKDPYQGMRDLNQLLNMGEGNPNDVKYEELESVIDEDKKRKEEEFEDILGEEDILNDL